MDGSCVIDRATAGPKEKARLIRTLFEREMLPTQKEAIRSRELVNVHLKMRGKSLSIPRLKVDETGLFAAGVALLALEV